MFVAFSRLPPGSTRFLLQTKDGESILVVRIGHEQYYAIESVCPHAGGPLNNGEIVDIEEAEPSIICPYHGYSFSLLDGSNSAVSPAKTWTVRISAEGLNFAGDPFEIESVSDILDISDLGGYQVCSSRKPAGSGSLNTLLDYAVKILETSDPLEKTSLTEKAARAFLEDDLPVANASSHHGRADPSPPDMPFRDPDDSKMVHYSRATRLGAGGSVKSRVAILHNLANVELWAIDLAWDCIARFARYNHSQDRRSANNACPFADKGHGELLPDEFFRDFVQIAREEAKHHILLRECLEKLGSEYGALPTHARLWDSAVDTKHSLICRIAVINMIHEARGLDVNPQTIAKFRKVGDEFTAEKLQIIHNDEIKHCYRGQKWFSFFCDQYSLEKYAVFQDVVNRHFVGHLRPPFNREDRGRAGIDEKYYTN